MNNKLSYRSWFSRFFIYNLIFLSLQFGLILSKGGSFLHTVPLPVLVHLELMITLGIHLSLYFLLSLLQMALLWGVIQWLESPSAIERWHLAIWSLSIGALLAVNTYFFPLSVFSRLFLPAVPHSLLIFFMLFTLFCLFLFILNTFWMARPFYQMSILSVLLIVFLVSTFPTHSPTTAYARRTNPNIIFIGVDSLSPHSINLKDTPHLISFIQNSVYFKETISPLAHTYPAWSSILTGLYPQHHQAQYNLIPADMVKSRYSIAWSLQKKGYHTLFATDDRRFNNIDKDFGFQEIIGPKMGVNDVLLGSFNDFPLSNLLINFNISRWLFPYNHMNRASYFSYYPQQFDTALHDTLANYDQSSPLFLAVHFTLPHWPYAWATSTPAQVKDEYSVEEREQLYLQALQQVDKQVANLLNELDGLGYLDNSMVVLLSDHGETMYVSGSRQTSQSTYQGTQESLLANYFKRKTSTALDRSAGHGSDLLSADQYHSVLAFQIYKHQQLITSAKTITTRVALIDINPTLAKFLALSPPYSVDGISLLDAIIQNKPLPPRAFFMESGMLPNQFLTREKARILGQQFFAVDPKGKLHLRKNELATLDALKLYAIIDGNWVLALYPDDDGYIPVTLRLSDTYWIDNFKSEFAKTSPSENMLTQLRQFYHTPFILKPQTR